MPLSSNHAWRRVAKHRRGQQLTISTGPRPLSIERLEQRDLLHAAGMEGPQAISSAIEEPQAALGPNSLYPDLTPWASQSQGFVFGWTVRGDELRLTTAMANVGDGRLELRGGASHGNLQDVYQRIYEPNGAFTDVLAGSFIYHPEHGHIHFEDFAEFRLRQVLPGGGVGDIVATGDKVSFCLLDVQRYDTSGPNQPYFVTCGQVQGISVGWADVYDQGLDGQSIPITTVPNGSYWLEVVVDPLDNILETDETNNVYRQQINLQRQGGGSTIPLDSFEPNDSFGGASILAPPEDHVYEDLTIHSANNQDYFRVTASATGPLTFSIDFQHSLGDMDMEVFNSAQLSLGLSDSVTNHESFTVNATAGQFYYVRAFGYNGATNPDYTFTVNQTEGPGPQIGDFFEDNDTFGTAASLTATDQTYAQLSIDIANDDDYYAIVPATSGTLAVSLAFLNSQGNINLQIFNSAQTQLAQSVTTGNSESASVPVTAGQTYYVRVYGQGGTLNPNYSMTIDAPAAAGGDPFEQNDTFATARSLGSASKTHTGLSIDAANDDDYYSIVPLASGTMTVNLAFTHSQGDIDMQLLNASRTQLALSDSTSNSEQASIQVTAGTTYYIRAFGYNGATNPNYTLSFTLPSPPAPPSPDSLEENDSFGGARSLAASDQTYSALTINAANDDDYYAIVPAASGSLVVSLAFQNAQGNLNLQVFNSAQAQLAQSTTTGNSETATVAVTAGQTYYVRVFGVGGTTSPNYSMTINVPDALIADALEQNDTFATARSLTAVDQTYSSLTIDAPNDDDYYAIVPAASGTLAVSLAFQNAQGNINLQVFNSAQTQLAQSVTTGNSETASVAVTAGQTYYVRAFGVSGAVNPNYSLTINVPEPPAGDSLEENDSFAAARSLSAVDQTYSALTINATNDDDYYSIVPTASGTLAVSLAFQDAQGNIDLQVFNAAQTQLAQSVTTGNSEAASVAIVAGQTYYVRVFGAAGALSPNYSMTIDVPSSAAGDAFEDNDTFATARALAATDQTYSGLSIQAAGDPDYYSITPAVSGTLVVSLAFTNSQGDLDLQLFNASQTQLALSDGVTNSEQASIQVTAGQTYTIHVFGYRNVVNPNYSLSINVPEPAGAVTGVYYLSTTAGGTLTSTNGNPSLTFADSDILQLSVHSGGQYGYELHFDGSDVGLTTANEDIDAFAFLPDGSIVLSTVGAFSVPVTGGTLAGAGEDLLRFVPTSLGATTAGTWSIYFDGSDVGLTGTAENIDAVGVLADGRVLISTTGAISVTGASGQDEDLTAFAPTALGATTAGTWLLYFDGSDVGLSTNDNEDINALFVQESGGLPKLYFSTLGAFSVTGASGADEDAFAFTPTTVGGTTAGTFGPGLTLDGSVFGLGSFGIDGFRIGSPPPPAPLARSAASTAGSNGSGSALASSLAMPRNLTPPTDSAPVSARFSAETTRAGSDGFVAPLLVGPLAASASARPQGASRTNADRLLADLVDVVFGSSDEDA